MNFGQGRRQKVIISMRFFLLILIFSMILTSPAVLGSPNDYSVVINEIHYDPDVKTQLVEFIELYNASAEDIDLSGWYFSSGLSYRFEAGSTLPAGGYIIVVQNPTHIQAKWSTSRLVKANSAMKAKTSGCVTPMAM
jgi:hypothetical protein